MSRTPTHSVHSNTMNNDFTAMLRSVWGFDALRPSQQLAVESILSKRDTLVVMPTGGGKSLCYQAPAVFVGGLTVVVSPLLALMKDQVDSLTQVGVSAVRVDSTLNADEKREVAKKVRSGEARLLFVSPERLLSAEFQSFLSQTPPHTFAIDEAHCVSQWGHDFRPEYRQLGRIRELFPLASVHAFTATATQQVREDIVVQLGLRDANVLVNSFDRPNLTYRILPQLDLVEQIYEVCSKHRGQGGIVYCLRRSDVERITQALSEKGISAIGYHAGMSHEERKRAQEQFLSESVDVVVATVAFGMGIDRSNVRFVVHGSMPKSIEHYQQETGRAGRDGLPSECTLFYSAGDWVGLSKLTEASLRDANAPEDIVRSAMKHLQDMANYCRVPICRHRALVEYFGESYPLERCDSCDVCLGETDDVEDAKVISQKILSCVFRIQERFGVKYLVDVLSGSNTKEIRSRKHEALSTFGILSEHSKEQLKSWVFQLVGQQMLLIDQGEYPIVKLGPHARGVLHGDSQPKLIRVAGKPLKAKKATVDTSSLADPKLFEELRTLRRTVANEMSLPPYLVFHDNTLIEMAAVRPTTLQKLGELQGVGQAKLEKFGKRFLECIESNCKARDLSRDLLLTKNGSPAATASSAGVGNSASAGNSAGAGNSVRRNRLARHFEKYETLAAIAQKNELSIGTVVKYLMEWIESGQCESLAVWVPEETQSRILLSAKATGADRLKPIFEHLGGDVEYDMIRLTLSFHSHRTYSGASQEALG